MTLTVRANYWYTLWIVRSTVSNKKILNNYPKDVKREIALQADQHFKLLNYNFRQHTTFTLIEQLGNVNIEKDLATLQLKKHEDLWIKKLQNLYLHPYG